MQIPSREYTPEGLAEQERFQAQRRDALLRYADRVFYLNPDLRRFLPGAEFRPYASFDPFALEPTPAAGRRRARDRARTFGPRTEGDRAW